MLRKLQNLFGGGQAEIPEAPEAPGTPRGNVDPVHLAACALLLDVAWADGEYSDPERQHMSEVLARHFGLDTGRSTELLDAAERERSRAVDHFRFTRIIQSSYDLGQKMVLAELMWGIALADGKVADNEQYLTRKICNLLDLEPGYLATAKAAAERNAPQ